MHYKSHLNTQQGNILNYAIGAGFNRKFLDTEDKKLIIPDCVSFLEVGLDNYCSASNFDKNISLHLSRTPVSECITSQKTFIKHLKRISDFQDVISIGIHLIGERGSDIGILGLSSHFCATPQEIDNSINFIKILEDTFQKPVWIENANFYTSKPEEIVHTWICINEILDKTSAQLILDASHSIINAHNLGLNADTFLGFIPWKNVVEIHLSGIIEGKDGSFHDGHSEMVHISVWQLLTRCIELNLIPEKCIFTIEHVDPIWSKKKSIYDDDFRNLSNIIHKKTKFTKSYSSSDNSLKYAKRYFAKLLRRSIKDIDNICTSIGSSLDLEIEDFVNECTSSGVRVVLSEKEIYPGLKDTYYAYSHFINYLQKKYLT